MISFSSWLFTVKLQGEGHSSFFIASAMTLTSCDIDMVNALIPAHAG
jgi:hypothetical protein